MENKRVAIIVLNYNSWKHTIECLESIARIDYKNKFVVVCDNNSADDSVDRIVDWGEGRLKFSSPENESFSYIFDKPRSNFNFYSLSEGSTHNKEVNDHFNLFFIKNKFNNGFAAGNNLAIQYALTQGSCDFVWLLNNDTVVEPSSLNELVKSAIDNSIGMVGSKLVHYYDPKFCQELGGASYNKYFGLLRPIGAMLPLNDEIDSATVESVADYFSAASLLVSRKYIDDVGLMSEDYFLYFEEIDWVKRAEGRFRFRYCPRALIYHKHGGSIGSSTRVIERSIVSEYFGFRSRIKFTRKFHPHLLLLVIINILFLSIPRRILCFQFEKAKYIVLALLNIKPSGLPFDGMDFD